MDGNSLMLAVFVVFPGSFLIIGPGAGAVVGLHQLLDDQSVFIVGGKFITTHRFSIDRIDHHWRQFDDSEIKSIITLKEQNNE